MAQLKLGPHHMQGGNTTGGWLKLRPSVAKFVGDLGASVEVLDGTLAMGRLVDDGLLAGQGFDVNRFVDNHVPPYAMVPAYVGILQPFIDANPKIMVWEGPNEQILRSNDYDENGHTDDKGVWHAPVPGAKEKWDADRKNFMAWYGEFSYGFAQALHAQGKRAGIGSWASGQPRPEHNLWQYWTRGLQATVDFQAIECRHDYTDKNVTGLLRVVYDNGEFERLGFRGVPQVITELGVDVGGESWRQLFGGNIGECLDALIYPWLNQVAPYAWFVGACFYCDGGKPAWTNYDVSDSDIVKHLAAYVPPQGEIDMDETKRLAAVAALQGAATNIQDALDALAQAAPGPRPLYQAKTLQDLVLRDSTGNPAHDSIAAPTGTPGGVVKAGSVVPVYQEHIAAGPWQDRADITPGGLNIWMGAGKATLQRV